MKNKITYLLSISFVFFVAIRIAGIFFENGEVKWLSVVLCDGFVVPIILALREYQKSIPEEKLAKELFVFIIIVVFSIALLSANIIGIVSLFR